MTTAEAFQLGIQQFESGQLAQAHSTFTQILAAEPQNPDALHALGYLLYQTGDAPNAARLIQNAIALNPNQPHYHSNLGLALEQLAQLQNAVTAYQRAIQLDPKFVLAYLNLANLLWQLGRPQEAATINRQALAIQPDFAPALVGLGNCLKDLGQVQQAVNSYREAIAIAPDYGIAHNNLGNVLKDQGLIESALVSLRRAAELIQSSEIHSNLLFASHFDPQLSFAALFAKHQQWASQFAIVSTFEFPNNPDPDRRIRIGYVSPNLNDHVIGLYLEPILANHTGAVETFCYHDSVISDAVTKRLRSAANHWRETAHLNHSQFFDQVRQDQIDVLIDLVLHMERNRMPVFARKPSPIQCTYLAYPGTSGMRQMDCRISDPYLDPPGVNPSFCSEKTVRLPHSFWCYRAPENAPTLSLKTGPITFGSLNNPCKLNSGLAKVWARILAGIPNSRLTLLVPNASDDNTSLLALLTSAGLRRESIHLVSQRPRAKYLQLYNDIDISLDPFPYNGHTTSIDSLYMGVPVITLAGQTPVSRAGMSILSNIGMPELISSSVDAYIDKAVLLANDSHRLQELRSTLRQRLEQSPIVNEKQFALDIESLYREMWKGWCATKR